MKHIGVFCDGTWQHLDQPHPTNVAILARSSQAVASGVPQVVYYDDGVGVSQGVLDAATSLIGGALGKGLDYKIVRAYEFLALNYELGDRVFIFGFSRGAYTARSLAGLLRWMGVLKRENAGQAYSAMALYRTRAPQDAPDPEQAKFEQAAADFRKTYAHTDDPFVSGKPYVPGDPKSLTPDTDCTWVQYVGVWDTVGSLGIPSNLAFAPELDAKYRFYDLSLSRFVRSARHAVSIDERRKTFSPSLWTNMDDLNANASAPAAYADKPYQQRWFPGGHGSVGGGGADHGLSLPAMLWIAEGAARAGYGFSQTAMDQYIALADPCADFVKVGLDLGDLVIELDGLHDRRGIASFDEISLAARLRWRSRPDYKPAPLRIPLAFEEDLRSWSPPDVPVWFQP